MKILISGANGLIGKELVNFFSLNQHQVFKLVRKRTNSIAEKSVGFFISERPEANSTIVQKIQEL